MADEKQIVRFKGLTSAEVEESRRTHGANILTPPEREPWWKLFLEKFDDPVIRILIIAAVIAIVVGVIDGKYAEGVGIILAVLLATTLAFLNEYKAGKEFDILNQVNDEVPIKVLRDGNFTTIAKKDLVVNDVVLLEIGEEIPADGEVLEAVSFQVNQSRLTGESVPVRKMTTEELAKESVDEGAYTRNMLYRGTTV
ncbi:MAG TPA: haloacid dehalogenase, partial [Desulfobacteraceae bacterium]|nr:haloacid dehalogenase [Desulfobacteraceae bacterium]